MERILFKDESEFRKHIDKVRLSLTEEKAEDYKKCETSFEKFRFWRDNGPKFEVKPSRPNAPDKKKSLELKEEGNKFFKEGLLAEARDLYTKSLQFYPVNYEKPEENKDFAIIFANRAATLDVQGPYHAELQDVEMAFKYGYPKEMYFKLYNRKGHALLKLRQHVASRDAFNMVSNWIGKSDMNDKQREQWRVRMKKQMSVFASNKKLTNFDPPKRPLADELEHLEDYVTFNDDMTNVVASKDIKSEDLLMKEVAHATVLYDEGPSAGKICPITLTRLAAPVPCTFGSNVVFANEQAREKANASFHRYEWSITESMKEFGLSPIARLALRLITKIAPQDIKKIVAELRQADSNPKHVDGLSDNARVFALPTPTVLNLENSICVYLLINYFLECLQVAKYIPENSSEMTGDLVYLLARAILVCCEHSTTLDFGNFIQNKCDAWNFDMYPVSPYAVGIFPKVANLKHVSLKSAEKSGMGCDVIKFFQDDVIIVQSFRDITAGKSVNFGDEIRGKAEAMMPQDLVPFKCNGKNCGLSFPLHEKTSQNTIVCPSETCGIETNIWQKRKRIVEIRAQYDAIKGQLEKGKIRSAIGYIQDIIGEWAKIIARPYKEFTKLEIILTNMMQMEHADQEDEWIGFSSHWLRRAK